MLASKVGGSLGREAAGPDSRVRVRKGFRELGPLRLGRLGWEGTGVMLVGMGLAGESWGRGRGVEVLAGLGTVCRKCSR